MMKPEACVYSHFTKCFRNTCNSESHKSSNSDKDSDDAETTPHAQSETAATVRRKPGGWKAISFVLANDTLERLATFGLLANFMVYLTREMHLDQVSASNIIYIWSGLTNFAPLLGAFVSDSYVGRFRAIAFGSFSLLLGMATLTMTAWLPKLHPPPCSSNQLKLGQCPPPSKAQLGFLSLGLGFLSVGTGGIRPCSMPFGVDQFDPNTEEGKKGIKSFFNWYYATFTVVLLITSTLVVYIQDKISWTLGFGIPTLLMCGSIVLLFIGVRIYVHAKPQGSMFASIAQVFVAAHKKRQLKLPDDKPIDGSKLYDPPVKDLLMQKLPLTNQIRFLNKAAIIVDNDLKPDGSPVNKWRLCSVQQVEELKCVIKTMPIWASAIVSFTAMSQQGTFTVSQALRLNRHLGQNFEIPAGSLIVISLLTIGIFLPIYDRLLVPALRKVTRDEGGITVLQRIGIGIVFSVLAMLVAGFIEKERRNMAKLHPHEPVSFIWLAPQLGLMGLCEAFSAIGLLEFFNREFPDHIRSVGNALLSCSFAGSSYLSSVLVTVVHRVTGTHSKPDWLTNDINAGRLDLFYFLLAGIGSLNFVYFLYCARRYHYKGAVHKENDNNPYVNVELGSTTTA
ncbi:protein NRT1/ PTR FAMILY 2.13-like [Rosa rugosa]|uniref:protein NRT1/ PTR FAMILY 2.13-like n=1 Tax=Rosa rugosa TaxID=74645 RepID=UPI002B403A36|nr:protein NRT1/ PTR FAMILY 2.13-like [Rosa rugosa]